MAWVKASEETVQQGAPRCVAVSEKVFNSSNKTLSLAEIVALLGVGSRFDVDSVRVEIAATASPGDDRIIVLQLEDESGDVIWQIEAATVAAANGTTIYEFAPGLVTLDGSAVKHEPLPSWLAITDGLVLRIYDEAAVSPTQYEASSGDVSAGGSGYVQDEDLTVVGGTSSVAAIFNADTVGGSGEVTALSVDTAGVYTVLPDNPVDTTGGSGTGATIDVTWAQLNTDDMQVHITGRYQ